MNGRLLPRSTRRVTWRRLDGPGAEEAALFPFKRTWHLRGRLTTTFSGRPARIRYEIACDRDWGFRVAVVTMTWGSLRRRLAVSRDRRRGWHVSGKSRQDLSLCTDIDLSVTPSTNTIPIRRLALDIGGSEEVIAAWVRFPELTVEPLRELYTRLDAKRYRYESVRSGFAAELEVDDAGLVVTYPHLWQRA